MNYKTTYVILFLAIVFCGCVSNIPTLEQQSSLDNVREFPGKLKSDLYKRTLNWVARSYNSANDVVQLKDEENGQIICRGIGYPSCDLGIERPVRYTMIIDLKDGKIRTRYENIQSEHIGGVAGPNMSMQWEAVEKYFNQLSEDLFTSIPNIEKENNW